MGMGKGGRGRAPTKADGRRCLLLARGKTSVRGQRIKLERLQALRGEKGMRIEKRWWKRKKMRERKGLGIGKDIGRKP